ncbi:MAG TPA: hypothetical protein VHO28_09390 [Ignavibacteriales bacterium]|nr:hypothetical protein [Ignavibacteriales bacterium]
MKLGSFREFLKKITPVIPVLGIILYGFIIIIQEDNQLEKEPVYVNGYIYEVHDVGGNRNTYVSYRFEVDNKFYFAKEHKYNFCGIRLA